VKSTSPNCWAFRSVHGWRFAPACCAAQPVFWVLPLLHHGDSSVSVGRMPLLSALEPQPPRPCALAKSAGTS